MSRWVGVGHCQEEGIILLRLEREDKGGQSVGDLQVEEREGVRIWREFLPDGFCFNHDEKTSQLAKSIWESDKWELKER